jgi:hypothetical protein
LPLNFYLLNYFTTQGGTSRQARVRLQEVVNSPRTKERYILLITRDCGGVALNFQGVHHVIQLEPCYNPQKEEQAFGRIWRRSKNEACHHWRLLSKNQYSIDQVVERYVKFFLQLYLYYLFRVKEKRLREASSVVSKTSYAMGWNPNTHELSTEEAEMEEREQQEVQRDLADEDDLYDRLVDQEMRETEQKYVLKFLSNSQTNVA